MKRKAVILTVLFAAVLIVGGIFAGCSIPSKQADIVSVTNATVNGYEISMFVEHDVDSVSLANSVTTSQASAWVLSYDELGKDLISDKVAAGKGGELSNGDNVFYIIVTAEDKQHSNTYKLTIYRSFEVTISFYDDESLLAEKPAYSGKTYNIDYEPQLEGYTFNYWYLAGDPQTSVTSFVPLGDTSLYANKTVIPVSTHTITLESTTGGTVTGQGGSYPQGEQITFTAQTDDGYTWLGWYKNGVEYSMDFSITVEVEEDATYTAKWIACPIAVNYQVSGITDNSYQYVTFVEIPAKTFVGEQITLTAFQTSQIGYRFVGWYDSSYSATGKLLSDKLEYTFEMPSVTTKLYVRYDKTDEMKMFSFESTDEICKIKGLSSYDVTDIVIPDYVTEFVNQFNGNGALQATSITSVTIGVGITQIPDKTFYGCKQLGSVQFKGNVVSIGQYAFYQCTSLTSVNLPQGVTTISEYAFYKCTALTTVTIGGAVDTIEYAAFSGCTLLQQIGSLSSVREIGREAFYKCTALSSVDIPSIVTIGQSAFSGCTNLQSVSFGDSLTEMGSNAFEKSGLKSVVIPSSLRTVAESAFSNCASLSEIVINNGVVTLDSYCFQACPITSIVLPNSVEKLVYAFYNCAKLQSIVFGTGLNFIGLNSFYGCNALTQATFAVTEGWLGRNWNSTSGGIAIAPSDLADAATAATTLKNTTRSQNMVREDT